jgi:hypothetical protein
MLLRRSLLLTLKEPAHGTSLIIGYKKKCRP